MDGNRVYYAKRNKSEKDKYHDFTHMWNLRNKTNEHRGKKERQTENRLLTVENKLNIAGGVMGGGGGWPKWVTGIREVTRDAHWMLYVSGESINSTPETNITLYIN